MASISKPYYIEPSRLDSDTVELTPSRRSVDSAHAKQYTSVVNKYKDRQIIESYQLISCVQSILIDLNFILNSK